jgi:hypothetical protein
MSEALITSASRLYAVLHHTGGKVGGSQLWQKAVGETLDFTMTAFASLRTTFPLDGKRTYLVITLSLT